MNADVDIDILQRNEHNDILKIKQMRKCNKNEKYTRKRTIKKV